MSEVTTNITGTVDLYEEIEQRIKDAITARAQRVLAENTEQLQHDEAVRQCFERVAAKKLHKFAAEALELNINCYGSRVAITQDGAVELVAIYYNHRNSTMHNWKWTDEEAVPDEAMSDEHWGMWVLPAGADIFDDEFPHCPNYELNNHEWRAIGSCEGYNGVHLDSGNTVERQWELIGMVVTNLRTYRDSERKNRDVEAMERMLAEEAAKAFVMQWYHQTGYETVELADLQAAHEAGAELKVIFQQADGDYFVFIEQAAPSPAQQS